MPEHQPDATLDQPNPILNTYYTVLAATLNCRIIGIQLLVRYDPEFGTPPDAEVEVTVDGQTLTFIGTSLADNDFNYAAFCGFTSGVLSTDPCVEMHRAFFMEGRSVRIRVRYTAGDCDRLTCRVKWQRWT